MDSPGFVGLWLPLLRELGALALVAIVLLYLIRDYLPGLTARYLAQLQSARSDFSDTLERQRQDFTQALNSQQRLFEQHMQDRAKISDQRHGDLMQAVRESAKRRAHDGDRS